jgi:hypothetical protein
VRLLLLRVQETQEVCGFSDAAAAVSVIEQQSRGSN